MVNHVMSKAVREYLARIGQRGGEKRGRAKVRGNATYYRELARKRWQKSETVG